MPLRRHKSASSGSSGTVETRNILNGVLNCAWDKTSATPKLLEIANTSQVKFNIDSDNPLVLAFANGWDDKDRPAQVVKRLAVAPSNINLSDKANRHVQIVARVINDELVITTHDVYDPGVGTYTNILPVFTSLNSVDGWSISGVPTMSDIWKIADGNDSTYSSASTFEVPNLYYYITAPTPFVLCYATISELYFRDRTIVIQGKNPITNLWEPITNTITIPGGSSNSRTLTTLSATAYCEIRVVSSGVTDNIYGNSLYTLKLYEAPTAKYYRSLNKVKDRSDTEVNWINLGYATVDASGNITALYHYTDLRNNYPGGMRVEA